MLFAKLSTGVGRILNSGRHRSHIVRFSGTADYSPTTASSNYIKSLLYIPGDMANKVVSILKPAVTLDELVSPDRIDAMRANLRARGMLDVDFTSLLEDWNRLRKARAQMDDLRSKDVSTHQTFKELAKTCARLEEATMPTILKLPNDLHARTPSSVKTVDGARVQPTIVRSHRHIPEFDFQVTGHETLGRNTGTIVFRPNVGLDNAYYFKGSMAWLELATLDYFRRRFEDDGNFTAFSNPDFSKSIVVEACNHEFSDPRRTFHLERTENDANPHLSVDLHLTGSSSTNAFYAFHTKTRANESSLPLKYFAAGRSYRPVDANRSSQDTGLFGVSQASAMSFFVATGHETPADKSHDEMLTFLQKAFENLDLHFRVIQMPAADLLASESLRTEVQLWSPAGRIYHTVASVSVCEDFISRRLLMTYGASKSTKKGHLLHFLRVCHGTAISVPQFLACVIENRQTKDRRFTIPTQLQMCVDRLK